MAIAEIDYMSGGDSGKQEGTFSIASGDGSTKTITFDVPFASIPSILYVWLETSASGNFISQLYDHNINASKQILSYNRNSHTEKDCIYMDYPSTTQDAIQNITSSGFTFKIGSDGTWAGTFHYMAIA